MIKILNEKIIQIYDYRSNLDDKSLVSSVIGKDHHGQINEINVIEERPSSIYLNSQEIVTAMTIGDHPKYLALGFLKNQKLIKENEKILELTMMKKPEQL